MKSKYCFFIFISLLLLQSITRAQLPSLEKGTLIRITTLKYQYPIIANLEKISADSLNCFTGGRLFEFSIEEIEKIETKTKQKRHTVQGALYGAISGAFILGAIFSSTGGSDKPTYGPSFTKGELALMGALTGAFSGGLIGDLIGHSKITKDWEQIFPERISKPFLYGEKSPTLACAMSFLVPGLGQYYNGDIMKGLFQQILVVGGIIVAAKSSEENSTQKLIGIGMISGSVLWSIIDAPLSAMKKNKSLKEKKSDNAIELNKISVNLGLNVLNNPGTLFVQVSYHF